MDFLLKDCLTTKLLTKRAEPISSAKKHWLCLVFYHLRSQGSSVSILFDFLHETCVHHSMEGFGMAGCVSSFKCKSMFRLNVDFLLKDSLTTELLTKRAEPISSAKKHCLYLVCYYHRSQW